MYQESNLKFRYFGMQSSAARINPPIFWLVDELLYLLSYSHLRPLCNYNIVKRGVPVCSLQLSLGVWAFTVWSLWQIQLQWPSHQSIEVAGEPARSGATEMPPVKHTQTTGWVNTYLRQSSLKNKISKQKLQIQVSKTKTTLAYVWSCVSPRW